MVLEASPILRVLYSFIRSGLQTVLFSSYSYYQVQREHQQQTCQISVPGFPTSAGASGAGVSFLTPAKARGRGKK